MSINEPHDFADWQARETFFSEKHAAEIKALKTMLERMDAVIRRAMMNNDFTDAPDVIADFEKWQGLTPIPGTDHYEEAW